MALRARGVLDASREVLDENLRVNESMLRNGRVTEDQVLRARTEQLALQHQLRVATRRAGAALEIFRDCLPEKDYQTARKQLRRLRRAAGAARDWDVLQYRHTDHHLDQFGV